MKRVKVISFDAEGTLVTPRFSEMIWREGIPTLFANKNDLDIAIAKREVFNAYDEVGDQRMEWYDIKYWFDRFDLGSYEDLFNSHRKDICYYPEVSSVLSELSKNYRLVICSNSAREFLDILTEEIKNRFVRMFSATSDFGALKNPDLYLSMCQLLDISTEELVHVGDSPCFDFDAPQASGIRALYLNRDGGVVGQNQVSNLNEFAKLF